jgi:outer membrane biosynthesis protein TonB
MPKFAQPDFAKSALSKDAAGRNEMFADVRKNSETLQATHAKERAAMEEAMGDTAPESPALPEAPKLPEAADPSKALKPPEAPKPPDPSSALKPR